MILIGQYDSPFVRRVGIALRLYGIGYEHRPWSTFGDAALLRAVNPLCRVPTLVLDDGTALPDSATILDHLDEAARVPLRARGGTARLADLRRCALAVGICDKAVALVYERRLHEVTSDAWIGRCESQIAGTLAVLEAERDAEPGTFWFGETPGHADIALGCAAGFLAAAHPGLLAGDAYPAIARHAARCEALAVFQAVQQVFVPPT